MITEKLKLAMSKKRRDELAKIAGVDQSTFYRWGAGESKPRSDQLRGIWLACNSVGVELTLGDVIGHDLVGDCFKDDLK